MSKKCCFIGHSDTPQTIYPALAAAVNRHITEYGVHEFLVGNYGAFDRMAARAVREAKVRYPDTVLYLMLAYLPQPGREPKTITGIDAMIYPEGLETVPYKLAIPRLNRIMVEDSDYVIAYVTHSWGGAATTLKQAKKREHHGTLTILNLGE